MIRRISRQKKWIITIGLIVLITFPVTLFLNRDIPPHKEIEKYRKALSKAQKAQANIYAPGVMKYTEQIMEVANREWAIQDRKYFFNRDYTQLRKLVKGALQIAEESEKAANARKGYYNQTLKRELDSVQLKIETFKKRYWLLPLEKYLWYEFYGGELLIKESVAAYRRNDFPEANKRLVAGKSKIELSLVKAQKLLRAYLKNVHVWQQWATETVDWTKKNDGIAIIVDKMEHVCKVYKKGRLLTEFKVEFGSHWIGYKRLEGDGATPEGKYHVTIKKEMNRTKYYKALLINYPNTEDIKRFQNEIKNGSLSFNCDIGGLIEIHGEGGRGIHWTDGCIALRNKSMDDLYELSEIGTPVTIVGSLNNMKEE